MDVSAELVSSPLRLSRGIRLRESRQGSFVVFWTAKVGRLVPRLASVGIPVDTSYRRVRFATGFDV
jgi:hypothetical protein